MQKLKIVADLTFFLDFKMLKYVPFFNFFSYFRITKNKHIYIIILYHYFRRKNSISVPKIILQI